MTSLSSRKAARKAVFLCACITVFFDQAHAAPDAQAGQVKAKICFTCHGENGIATEPAAPNLAAQPALLIFYQLVQFREQYRQGGGMEGMAKGLSDQDMRDLAAYFTALPPPPGQAGDAAQIADGQRIAQQSFCSSCHGAQLQGQKHVPRLAGQKSSYLLTQMRNLRSGARVDMDGTMGSAVKGLSDAQIEALVAFAQSLN
jgi:cytochrome c553